MQSGHRWSTWCGWPGPKSLSLSLELMHAIDEEHTVFVTIISFFFFSTQEDEYFWLAVS